MGSKGILRGSLLTLCSIEELGDSVRQSSRDVQGGGGIRLVERFRCYLAFRPRCQNQTFRRVSRTVVLPFYWTKLALSIWHMLLNLPGQLGDLLPSAVAPCGIEEVQIALTFVWLLLLSHSKPRSLKICRETTLCKSTYAHYSSSIMLHAKDQIICSNDVHWLKKGA